MSGLTGRKTIRLTRKDKKEIGRILRSKEVVLREYKRARILDLVCSGYSHAEAALQVGVCVSTSRNICKRYMCGGLEEALYDRPRSGQPKKFTDKQKQRVVAMVCSSPPKGISRWTVRVIAEETKRRKIVDKEGISYETVRLILQSHELKPWREKNVVYRRVE